MYSKVAFIVDRIFYSLDASGPLFYHFRCIVNLFAFLEYQQLYSNLMVVIKELERRKKFFNLKKYIFKRYVNFRNFTKYNLSDDIYGEKYLTLQIKIHL